MMVSFEDIPTDCTSTGITYATGSYYPTKEEPEDYFDWQELKWKKDEQKFAVMNFNNIIPLKVIVQHVQIRQKRFRQKIR